MSRIVHTWELGAGSGHLSGFLPIATLLDAQGHELFFIVKDVAKAHSVLPDNTWQYVQAPLHWQGAQQTIDAVSYADILFNVGFDNEHRLLARIKAWQSLYRLLRPEMVIIDHSPTALLAAHILSLPRVLFGSGFFAPPNLSPLPSYRSWLKLAPQRLETSERQVLQVINTVLRRLGCAPLEKVADLFQVDENFLCTFKELDHYADRAGPVQYWGPRFNPKEGTTPAWLPGGENKIFAYLHPYYANLEKLLNDMRSSTDSFLVYSPGITLGQIRKYRGGNLDFVEQPVQIEHLARECELVICNAGHGLVSGALLAGLPLLLLPIHAEQMILAQNAAKTGAVLYALPEDKKANFKKMIKTLLTEPGYKKAAQDFARQHTDFNLQQRNQAIVDRCAQILRNSAPP